MGELGFFNGQESLTVLEWILRSLVSFVFLLLIAKLMGQRSISQLRFLDFIIALILGNIIAHPLSDEKLGLEGSMITTAVLVLLYIASSWLSLKWPLLKRYLDPSPLTLIKNGQIQFHNLSKAKISFEFLFSELRKEKAEDIQKIALAMWEPGGTLSVFIDPKYQPVTPTQLQLTAPPFTLVRPIIIQGKIDIRLLGELGRDLLWLKKQILPAYGEIHNVQLATIDESGSVKVYSSPPK